MNFNNMELYEFYPKQTQRLSVAIADNFTMLSYGKIQKVIRQKDVKIDGKRVSVDVIVSPESKIAIYLKKDENLSHFQVIYEDFNIIVVNKSKKIETISNGGLDLKSEVEKYLGSECFAVHRLDRNTSGLVVFAKNIEAKEELDYAFKYRIVHKFYLALVYGRFDLPQQTLTAYLKKDEKKSEVYISDKPKVGYTKIETSYKVLQVINQSTLIEVELLTGKTHQIRAHLAHIGHFVIGDEKYGDSKINKKYGCKYQCLTAYRIKFEFEKDSKLFYLNDITIELDKSKIEFLSNKF